jgi:two-component system, OmpR family, phosphate regulon sensor histidine kinase PhoR
MSLRKVFLTTICAAFAAGAVALLLRGPAAALLCALAAGAGALGAGLLGAGRGDKTSRAAGGGVEDRRRGERADGAAGARAGGAGAVADWRAELAEAEAGGAAFGPDELVEWLMTEMHEGLLVVDGEARVIFLNDAARELFGAQRARAGGDASARVDGGVLAGGDARAGGALAGVAAAGLGVGAGAAQAGRRRLMLSDLTRNPAILGPFAEAVGRGRRVEGKVEGAGPEGRAFSLRVVPLELRRAGRRGALGVFFDITRLERLERVRQEFLSNVSHELRTPLTAIRAFVETLEAGAIDEPEHSRRFLSVIDRNAARMHELIDDILELSAIESGRVEFGARTVPLRARVADVLTALAPRAAGRGVALKNEVAGGVTVRADPRRLEQMLTNLVDNAIKFNRAGGEVSVTHERAGGRDRVTVADTGEGIAAEHLPRIFERFYRVERARSRELGGTGLGLAIVKHLARAHGGEATVRSESGRGSAFTVELPAAEEGMKDEG